MASSAFHVTTRDRGAMLRRWRAVRGRGEIFARFARARIRVDVTARVLGLGEISTAASHETTQLVGCQTQSESRAKHVVLLRLIASEWDCLPGNAIADRGVLRLVVKSGRGELVKVTYDIFRRLPDGGPIWIEAVQTLEGARARLKYLLEAQPGDYFVYDLVQNKIIEYAEYADSRN